MSAFIEPLILYLVLFFRFVTGPALPEAPVEFSAEAAAVRLVLHVGPSLALIWYLLLKTKSAKEWGLALPGKKDALPAVAALSAIVLVGFVAAFLARNLGGAPEFPRILPPTTAVPWAILAVSVFGGAYLEESFFRFYLLSPRNGAAPEQTGYGPMGLGRHRAVFVSTLLFAVCHIHSGPWGFANAAVSGAILSYIFLRSRSLHGVSIAHGLYNVLVFVLGPA